ncbi:sterol desaturase family protein [Hyphococcus formosus]|uniref:sterol desaturase family protein n=1 Tax=Hyphococcus formosus TaxID=3143534 RepID=UPI00398A98D6
MITATYDFLLSSGSAKIYITGLVFIALFAVERVVRAAKAPDDNARLVRNFGLMAIIFLMSPLIIAPLTALGANNLIWTRPEWANVGIAAALFILIDLVLLDCWTYWMHRFYHRVPLMWRLHKVHHLDEFLDTTSAFRFHFCEVVLSAILRLIPIMILAPSLGTVILYETLLVVTALFHHSNVKLPNRVERALSRIIVTPSIHWVHHHAVKADTNSNFAAVFSFWDRLFRSKSRAERDLAMKIGLESIEDKSLFGLILMPFIGKEQ